MTDTPTAKRPIYGCLPKSPAFIELLKRALWPLFKDSDWVIENNTLYAEYEFDSATDQQLLGAVSAALSIFKGNWQAPEFVCTHKIQAHGLTFYGRPVKELEGNSAAEFDCVEAHCINADATGHCSVNRTRFNNGHIVTTLRIPKVVKLAA